MSELRICGYRPLSGEIKIQGSKNGALPMLAAAVLQKGTVKFTNVPTIQDVACMVGILESMGCRCESERSSLLVDASGCMGTEIPQEDVGKMRSSILIMGALLGRFGKAVTWYPGGCSIGSRPIDLHLMAFSRLGATVREEKGRIEAVRSGNVLTGAEIRFPFPSVGATENALLASVLAEGKTEILGAAREPEIQSLCQLLNQMGAKITGAGTSKIQIVGVKELHGTEMEIPGDRIAAGTYLAAVTSAGGRARLWGAPWEAMQETVQVLRQTGARISPVLAEGAEERPCSIQASSPVLGMDICMDGRPKAISLSTGPYPGFPTDLQSLMLAVLSRAEGISRIQETVFEARFRTADELWKMGAEIQLSGDTARIYGTHRLHGAQVQARDLRGGAALAVAALAAEGESRILDCIHIERGYEDICRDLRGLGGTVEWIGGEVGGK